MDDQALGFDGEHRARSPTPSEHGNPVPCASMRTGRARREKVQALAVVVGVLAVVVGVIAAIAASRGSSHAAKSASVSTTSSMLTAAQLRQRDIAASWSDLANKAFGGDSLPSLVSTMVNGQSDYQAGKLSAADFASELAPVLAAFTTARDKVMALQPFPLSRLVKNLYIRAAELYVEAVRLLQIELAEPSGAFRDQTGLAARRSRELGDRVFDRGHVIIEAFLPQPASGDVEIHLPEEVPEWTAEGLAAGPPLEPFPPPPPPAVQPEHQPTRPTESRIKWLRAVHDTVAPSGPQIAVAIATPDPTQLHGIADALQAATDHLRTEPDPQGLGGREESARYRLALLVREESARAAQLMELTTDPTLSSQLRSCAERLLLIADGVVPADLALPPSGLDPSLLTAGSG